MGSLLIFLFILGILIIVHEFGHFIAARKIGVRVEKFSLGFGPQLFKKRKGDTEYSLSAIPLGGYVKLAGDTLEEYSGKNDEFFSKPPGKRFWVIFCGPVLNYLLGFVFLWFIFIVGYPALTSKVGSVLAGFGAEEAGLLAGDEIISVDGKSVSFWEELQQIIQNKKPSSKVNLDILREGRKMNLDVVIKEKTVDGQFGQKRSIGLLGITPTEEIVTIKHGFIESFILSLKRTWFYTATTYKGLWWMVSGRLSIRDSVTGPLGIFFITSTAASMGIIALLHLVALLSISLAIFNLMPLPVLDGGHILFLGIERIRGRSLSPATERIITQIGITLILCLALFVTYNDALRFFGDRINSLFGK